MTTHLEDLAVGHRELASVRKQMSSVAAALSAGLFALAGVVIWWPSFDRARFVPTVLAPVVAAAVVAAFAAIARSVPMWAERGAIVLALALWVPLIVEDDRWSITVVAMYVLAWSAEGILGAVLAVLLTIAWSAGWMIEGADVWMLAIPCSVLAGSFFVSWAADRIAADNDTKSQLIARLESSRQQLADAERERGALSERARFASEVHDTLAQGFTSIVLLSRVGQRGASESNHFVEIEEIALANLDAARRLVANARPVELDEAQLCDALRRQLHAVIGEEQSTLTVHGSPTSYGSALEVAAFRAVQEALHNAKRHADPKSVEVVVHHLEDELVVDVIDNGNGFVVGGPTSRLATSGGQGLQAMRDRVSSLGGSVHVDSVLESGTTVSIRLPAGIAR